MTGYATLQNSTKIKESESHSHDPGAALLHALSEASIFNVDYLGELDKIHSTLRNPHQNLPYDNLLYKNVVYTLLPGSKKNFANGITLKDLYWLRFRVYYYRLAAHESAGTAQIIRRRTLTELLFGNDFNDAWRAGKGHHPLNILKALYNVIARQLPEAITFPLNAFLQLGFALTDKMFLLSTQWWNDDRKLNFMWAPASIILRVAAFLLRLPFGAVDNLQEVFHLDTFWIAPFREAWKKQGFESFLLTLLQLGKVVFTGAAIILLVPPDISNLIFGPLSHGIHGAAEAISHLLHTILVSVQIDALFNATLPYLGLLTSGLNQLLGLTLGQINPGLYQSISHYFSVLISYKLAGEVVVGLKPGGFFYALNKENCNAVVNKLISFLSESLRSVWQRVCISSPRHDTPQSEYFPLNDSSKKTALPLVGQQAPPRVAIGPNFLPGRTAYYQDSELSPWAPQGNTRPAQSPVPSEKKKFSR